MGYVNNAPENVVLAEKRKLEEELVSLDIINEKLKQLNNFRVIIENRRK